MIAPKNYSSRLSSGDPLGDQPRSPPACSRGTSLIHRGFVAAGSVLLMSAFCTDYVYCATALWQWANFSSWLITAGLFVLLIAVLAALFDFTLGRAVVRLNRRTSLLVAVAGLLSLVNACVHSRDAWTSVAPQGIFLSAVCVILLAIAGAQGWSLVIGRVNKELP